ncbi:hypothetical protein BJV74DRAFT_813160 [Russula compacta]|nr:hypothetical protein BJV74DRAFT_813160 [Russula compacta]
MPPVKKSSSSKAPKKAVAKSAPTHPSWTDMIKECISTYREDARHGVSRPQIKKFVEEKYKLEIGNAQVTQLSKAIAVGAEKGIFSLPKGPSGRVKLAPKTLKAADDAKENKPTSKTSKTVPPTKAASKPATKPGSKTKAVAGKSATAAKSSAGRKAPSSKTAPTKASPSKTIKKPAVTSKPPKPAAKPPTAKKTEAAPKRTYAGKRGPEKKAKSSTSRVSAKKVSCHGGTAATKVSKAKAASTKKASSKSGSTSRFGKVSTQQRRCSVILLYSLPDI